MTDATPAYGSMRQIPLQCTLPTKGTPFSFYNETDYTVHVAYLRSYHEDHAADYGAAAANGNTSNVPGDVPYYRARIEPHGFTTVQYRAATQLPTTDSPDKDAQNDHLRTILLTVYQPRSAQHQGTPPPSVAWQGAQHDMTGPGTDVSTSSVYTKDAVTGTMTTTAAATTLTNEESTQKGRLAMMQLHMNPATCRFFPPPPVVQAQKLTLVHHPRGNVYMSFDVYDADTVSKATVGQAMSNAPYHADPTMEDNTGMVWHYLLFACCAVLLFTFAFTVYRHRHGRDDPVLGDRAPLSRARWGV